MASRIQIAAAALVRDGRVLMAHRRPARAAFPDRWSLVGGHVEAGESPLQAVRQECFEELGIRIDDPSPIPMTVHAVGLTMHGFLVTRWTGEPVNVAPQEHDDLRWFRPGELADVRLAHPESLSSIRDAVRSATGPAAGTPGCS